MSPDRHLEILLRRLKTARHEATILSPHQHHALLRLLAEAEQMTGELREQHRRVKKEQRVLAQRRRRADEQLRRLQMELLQMPRLSLLGEIISELAHELNQPLAASISYAQTGLQQLRKGQARPEGLTEILELVIAQGKRAGRILQRLRGFTRTQTPQRQPTNLADLCREAVRLIDWNAQHRGVRIHLNAHVKQPLASVDELQIKQVLLNLLRNAIDAMTTTTTDARGHIHLELSQHLPDSIQIAIADTGSGLSEEVMARMFEPFFTTRPDALGMGLCLSRTIVEAHGGQLWGEPNPERGATFYLRLPLAQPTPD